MPDQARSARSDEERVGAIAALTQRLLLDLARHGRGEGISLDYLEAGCATRVHRALALLAAGGASVEADYGDSASGTAHLAGDDDPVAVEFVVDDRSMLRHADGRREDVPTARWVISIDVDATCTRITDLEVRTP